MLHFEAVIVELIYQIELSLDLSMLLLVSLQRQVFSALSQISKHSVSLAEMVVEADIFPAAIVCLRDPDEYVKKNVTTLMREVVKHTPEVQPAHSYL